MEIGFAVFRAFSTAAGGFVVDFVYDDDDAGKVLIECIAKCGSIKGVGRAKKKQHF